MSKTSCDSELWLRARRGLLSTEAEQSRWEAHLAGCETCQFAFAVADDFECEAVHRPEDGAMVTRLSATVARRHAKELGRQPAAFGHAPLRRRAMIALGIALGTAAAAAATLSVVRETKEPVVQSAPPLEPAKIGIGPTSAHAAAEALPSGIPEETDEAAPESDDADPPVTRTPTASGPSAAKATDPTALYRSANEARRAGNTTKAIRLFRALQHTFPSSREASLSHVSLGGLLLETGNPSAALTQFDRHLGQGSQRALGAEALYGRGRALAALSRNGEERKTWEALIREYPKCPYISHARRRIALLRGNL